MRQISELRRPVRVFLFRRRRPLAAALVFCAVLAATLAVRPDPGGESVVVASQDLPAGTTIDDGDLTKIRWSADTVPDGAATHAGDVTGRTLAFPMRAGEAFTDVRFLGPDLLREYGADAVLTTIRIADAAALTGMRAGERIAVIGTEPETSEASVISRDVRLLAPPPVDDDRVDQGVSVQVVAPEAEALRFAEVAMDSRLTVVAVSRSGGNQG